MNIIMISGLIREYVFAHKITINVEDIEQENPFSKTFTDEKRDWIDLETRQITTKGYKNTDIVSGRYSTDGKTLNATLWLDSKFDLKPLTQEVDYGMFIDKDFDTNTGFGGIDYKLEISWNNQSKTWSKVLEEWSPFGETRILSHLSNYTGFYGPNSYYCQ
jgi:hypothetical protein